MIVYIVTRGTVIEKVFANKGSAVSFVSESNDLMAIQSAVVEDHNDIRRDFETVTKSLDK